MALAGDDVGVPIMATTLEGRQVGFAGPILSGVPGPKDSVGLFDLTISLAGIQEFSELKRRRPELVLPDRP